jgi:hypothetical protein
MTLGKDRAGRISQRTGKKPAGLTL